jgi:hypothetical protein
MGITSLIGKLFGADGTAPPDATKLDGTTEAALARSKRLPSVRVMICKAAPAHLQRFKFIGDQRRPNMSPSATL